MDVANVSGNPGTDMLDDIRQYVLSPSVFHDEHGNNVVREGSKSVPKSRKKKIRPLCYFVICASLRAVSFGRKRKVRIDRAGSGFREPQSHQRKVFWDPGWDPGRRIVTIECYRR